MDEISHWMSYEEIEMIPYTVRSKINSILKDYHVTVTTLQNDLSISTNTYENTIENLTKKLQEENQKYLELEMNNLKTRVTNDKQIPYNKARHSKHYVLLKKKIEVLNRKKQEMEQKERSLNAQVEFLMENYDKDSKEMCRLVGEYLGEISTLKNRLEEGSYENSEKLLKEISILRKNEKEYQDHVYEKASEIFALRNELNASMVKNETLEQYRTKYNLLHDEFLKISGSLNESRSNIHSEVKTVLDKIDTLKNVQEAVLSHLSSQNIQSASLIKTNELSWSDKMDLGDIVVAIQRLFPCIFNLIKTTSKIKEEAERFVSNLIWTSEEQTKKILEQENLIEEFKKTIHNQPTGTNSEQSNINKVDFDRLSAEANLLRLENEALKRQIDTLEKQTDAMKQSDESVSENILKQNKMLISDIENLRDEIDKLTRQNKSIQGYKNEIESQAEKIRDLQRTKEKYEEKLRKYQNEIENLEDENNYLSRSKEDRDYVEDLEKQLERYKNDVKMIHEQFSQYKKLYESFNIEENTRKTKIMRENIEKKDVLINKLFHLIERYRRVKSIFDLNRSSSRIQ